MNRIYVLVSLCVFLVSFLAAEPVLVGSGSNSLSILENSSTQCVLHYQIGRFDVRSTTIGNQEYRQLSIAKEGVSQLRGYPELPVFNRSIMIPAQAKMQHIIFDVEYTDLPMRVAPSKGVITRDRDPQTVPWEFGPVYADDTFYPQDIATLSEPYILREIRGITINCNPMAYNPVSGTLRIYTSFKIKVQALGTDSRNSLEREPSSLSEAFMPIYQNHFINWPDERYIPVDDTFGKLLVICHSSLISNIASYVNWKRQMGIDVELVDFSSIGTTSAQLRTYLQNRYNADNNLSFVQLVGDASQIPTLSYGGGGSDPSFSLVAGTDSYPDIFVGRFSATNATELNAQINKAIAYERDVSTTATWLQRAMGIASSQGGGSLGDNGESDIQHMNNIRSDLLAYGYSPVDQIYDPSASAATVSTNINSGRGFVNYVGHGNTTSWGTTGFSNSNASALTNGNKTPFVMDVACLNGNFVAYTCFAEAWLRNASGGAVAMYASSINQSWNSPMRAQDECTDLLIAESKTTIGGLFFNASCKMMDVYGSDGIDMFKTWHIFGDAALTVRTKTPIAMTVSHPSSIIIGTNSITINTGVADARVALTYNHIIYATAFTNDAGIATLHLLDPPLQPMVYTLTVTAFNRVSYIGNLQQIIDPTPVEPRFVAEWESALGAVISYPFGLPYSLISDLAQENLLYVVVSTTDQSAASNALTVNGVNMANVRWINAPTNTYWIRDYGPWTIFDANNQMHIVDFNYNRPRPNDNLIPDVVANYLGLNSYTLNLTHTGGNIMTDGQGKAMSTELVLAENSGISQSQIEQEMASQLGIEEYQLYPDPTDTYIEHIDCWAKLLDVDKVLICSVPTYHSQYSAIENVVTQWQSKTSSLGKPYRIFRVYTPNDEPYTNSFILNGKIHVPQMGTANDAAALQVYRNAMPGYEIEGYSAAGYAPYESTDAIHCRVNTIFDPQLIAIKHIPPASAISHQDLVFTAEISHTNPLSADASYLAWKIGSNGNWQNDSLIASDSGWAASLTAPALGDTIFYWINASDLQAKNCRVPLCAEHDPYMVVVDVASQLDAPELIIAHNVNGYELSWNSVAPSISYKIMASTEPNGEYSLIGTTTALSWHIDASAPRMFFKVVAESHARPLK